MGMVRLAPLPCPNDQNLKVLGEFSRMVYLTPYMHGIVHPQRTPTGTIHRRLACRGSLYLPVLREISQVADNLHKFVI